MKFFRVLANQPDKPKFVKSEALTKKQDDDDRHLENTHVAITRPNTARLL